ncbi:MAG: aminotransferase class V-fold PLP-dependent enzyme [Candidatus Krumholzibacteriia bacterium]
MDDPAPYIHLDNAATSFPKPPGVGAAMAAFLAERAVNPGRAGTDLAREAGAVVDGLRRRLDRFFNNPARDPDRCVFTANATDALNLAIGGLCRPGDHVVSTVTEHNSVLRPLHELARRDDLRLDLVGCDGDGRVDPDAVAAALRPQTRLVVVNHASNVCGTVQPVAAIAAACRAHGVPVLLDAAQSAGIVPVDMTALGVDLVAFTGHKSLLGPTGTGGLVAGPDVELEPTRFGGTGVRSAELTQPRRWPWRLEAGTLNAVGLAGLAAGLDWLQAQGQEALAAHERALADRFLAGCRDLPRVRVVGHGGRRPDHLGEGRTAVVAVTVQGLDPAMVGEFLDVDWGVGVRTGLHCAPLLHAALGTAPAGAVRFAFGPFNTPAHVDRALAGLAAVARA